MRIFRSHQFQNGFVWNNTSAGSYLPHPGVMSIVVCHRSKYKAEGNVYICIMNKLERSEMLYCSGVRSYIWKLCGILVILSRIEKKKSIVCCYSQLLICKNRVFGIVSKASLLCCSSLNSCRAMKKDLCIPQFREMLLLFECIITFSRCPN